MVNTDNDDVPKLLKSRYLAAPGFKSLNTDFDRKLDFDTRSADKTEISRLCPTFEVWVLGSRAQGLLSRACESQSRGPGSRVWGLGLKKSSRVSDLYRFFGPGFRV
eukprot:1815144-Rhodomonas_salina.2